MIEESSKPVIDLLDFDGLGLIILFPSNVMYSNQIGGYACLHPEIEGVFVPLLVGNKKLLFALEKHFNGNWHHIEETDADIIDRLLKTDGFNFIKVDRSKLKESFEAWIYVDVDELNETYKLISNFGRTKGILTWANSD